MSTSEFEMEWINKNSKEGTIFGAQARKQGRILHLCVLVHPLHSSQYDRQAE
jgi:hypothetical protein